MLACASSGVPPLALSLRLRPIFLLGLSLLRFLDSNFPGHSLWTWEFHPSILRFCLSQTLWNHSLREIGRAGFSPRACGYEAEQHCELATLACTWEGVVVVLLLLLLLLLMMMMMLLIMLFVSLCVCCCFWFLRLLFSQSGPNLMSAAGSLTEKARTANYGTQISHCRLD